MFILTFYVLMLFSSFLYSARGRTIREFLRFLRDLCKSLEFYFTFTCTVELHFGWVCGMVNGMLEDIKEGINCTIVGSRIRPSMEFRICITPIYHPPTTHIKSPKWSIEHFRIERY